MPQSLLAASALATIADLVAAFRAAPAAALPPLLDRCAWWWPRLLRSRATEARRLRTALLALLAQRCGLNSLCGDVSPPLWGHVFALRFRRDRRRRWRLEII